MNFPVKISVNPKTVESMLISLTDSGASDYWLSKFDNTRTPTRVKRDCDCPATNTNHWAHCEVLRGNGFFKLTEEDGGKKMAIGISHIKKGLQLMADNFPKHFGDVIAENEDSHTADLLLQLACFGEEKYA